jgi:hypothetical protein
VRRGASWRNSRGAAIETKVNYALVGAFVLVLGAVLIGGVLWLASGGAFQQKYDLYLAIENESVAGLNVNAPVKYHGVEVGKVKHIHLDPEDTERVNLLFAIERGTPIKEDTVAVLKTGLTGIAYVELAAAPGTTTCGQPRKAVSVIHTKPSLSARLENMLTSAPGELDDLPPTSMPYSAKNRGGIQNALADIAVVTYFAERGARRRHCQRSAHVRQRRPRDGTTRPGDRAHRPQRRSRRKDGGRGRARQRQRGQDRRRRRRRRKAFHR